MLHLDPQHDASSPPDLDGRASSQAMGGSVAQQGCTYTVATSVLPTPSHFSCLEIETRVSPQGYGS